MPNCCLWVEPSISGVLMLSPSQSAQAVEVVAYMRKAVLDAKSRVVGYAYDSESKISIMGNLERDSQKIELFATDKLDEVRLNQLDYTRWFAIMQTIYGDIRDNDSAVNPWGLNE